MKLSDAEREAASQAASQLITGFDWSKTKEGHGYWQTVYQRLRQIAEDGELT